MSRRQVQPTLPVYEAFTRADRALLHKKAQTIDTLARRSARDMVQIGKLLIQAQAIVYETAGGLWEEWVCTVLGWSLRSAEVYMSAASRFGDLPGAKFAPLGKAVLGFLSSPSVPDSAVQQVLGEAEQAQQHGGKLTCSRAQEIIEEHQAAEEALAGLTPAQQEEVRRGAAQTHVPQSKRAARLLASVARVTALVYVEQDPASGRWHVGLAGVTAPEAWAQLPFAGSYPDHTQAEAAAATVRAVLTRAVTG